MVFSCVPCFFSKSLVPVDHTELSREELKALYEKSIALNNGRLIVHGIFARANTKNNNKRVYPKHILEREVARFEAEHIRPGTALGELDHPNYASKYFKCLNLPNISHQVLDVKWKDDQLWGTIEVLPTPSGLLLWELYSRGVKLGVSSRGWASLKSDPQLKCIFVDDDFELITFDFVTEPSTKGAYLVPVQRLYKRPLPDQQKYVQIAHLGHGVAAMEKVCRIPDPTVLVQRVAELQRHSQVALQGLSPPDAAATYGESLLQRMPASFKPSGLDNLLCYGHYVVHQSAVYLDREQHARDYRAHLVIFTARAHLADEHVGLGGMTRSDMDHVILNQVAARDSFDPASKSFACQLGVPAYGAGMCAPSPCPAALGLPDVVLGRGGAAAPPGPAGDLGSWAMHPNALESPGTSRKGGNGAASGVAVAAGAGYPGHPHPAERGAHSASAQRGRLGSPVGSNPGTLTYNGRSVRELSGSGAASGRHESPHAPGSAGPATPHSLTRTPSHQQQQQQPGYQQQQPGHQQQQQQPGHQQQQQSQQGGGGGPGLVAPGQLQLQGHYAGTFDDAQLMGSWLGLAAGSERVVREFLRIRATLISYAQLYQLHQQRVEQALLRQASR